MSAWVRLAVGLGVAFGDRLISSLLFRITALDPIADAMARP